MKPSPATEISPEAAARLADFLNLLRRWNRRINLVARGDEPRLWQRHVLDAAQLIPLLPSGPDAIIDLGSGAGFPGIILAVLTGRFVHLVEADLRKAAFLREAVRATAAPARVHAVRAESTDLPRGAVVTARGLAPLPALLPLAAPRLLPGGLCLFPKGGSVESELTAAAKDWQMKVERFPSRTSRAATILRLSEIGRASPTA